MIDIDPQDLADRYIAQWTEPDTVERRAAVERLWVENGTRVLHPPLEIREVWKSARSPQDSASATPSFAAQGHDAGEARGEAGRRT